MINKDIKDYREYEDEDEKIKIHSKSSHIGARKRERREELLKQKKKSTSKTITGIVSQLIKDGFLVYLNSEIFPVRIPKRLLQLMQKEKSFVAVGDTVELIYNEINKNYEFLSIGTRINELKREYDNRAKIEQTFAANIDLVIIMASLAEPAPRYSLIDRFVLASYRGGVEASIVFNKIDLLSLDPSQLTEILCMNERAERFIRFADCYDAETRKHLIENKQFFMHNYFSQVPAYHDDLYFNSLSQEEKQLSVKFRLQCEEIPSLRKIDDIWIFLSIARIYKDLGHNVIFSSIESMTGLEKIIEISRSKKVIFCGPSGVGKSSIINLIDRDAKQKVKEISEWSRKGRHTTTNARLIPWNDGCLIDTPGVRTFSLGDVTQPDYLFKEFAEEKSNCLLPKCRHIDEEGCAIIKCLENEKISHYRYQNYRKILLKKS
ncbi:MAG: ribosome small subunit-dependent GTPase A [Candidatus Coatesbacteria bacterium]|nr:ribosome small subunit-dependent GTPase A [Candidatus Coatesbacteria bacterium]